MKAVLTLSSLAGQMGPSSEAAHALDKPAEAFDRMQLAYKVSKAALNQGALSETETAMTLAATNPASPSAGRTASQFRGLLCPNFGSRDGSFGPVYSSSAPTPSGHEATRGNSLHKSQDAANVQGFGRHVENGGHSGNIHYFAMLKAY